MSETVIQDEKFSDEDWYGEELDGRAYSKCTFREVDLTEAANRGSTFEECTFGNVKFNASKHASAAFIGCTFLRCNFFDAEFDGCKLVGSTFKECVVRPLRVSGGDWSFVSLSGSDLRNARFHKVRMREADLSGANCEKSEFVNVDLSAAQVRGAKFGQADLRGSDLSAFNPYEVELKRAIIGVEQAMTIAQALGLEVR